MLIVRGINVFPSQIQNVISKIPQVGEQFQLILDRNKHMLDELTVEVELEDTAFTGDLKDLAAVQSHVQYELKAVLNIRTNVVLLEKGSIERTAGKAKRIIDRRQQI
jgi:phenylacetate-CoA ligase